MSPRVVIVGPPAAGKSTVAALLAERLGVGLVDSDELIAKEHGRPCGEVFAELGEPEFRRAEERAVARALASGGVVSLGGGAVISTATRRLLADLPVAWLDVSAAEAVRRTSGDDSRPVLQAEDPLAHYENLLRERRGFYEDAASFQVSTDEATPEEAAARVAAALPREVAVEGEAGYPVTIGRGVLPVAAARVAELGAGRCLVVAQPALRGLADRLCGHLFRRGIVATIAELPDAEAGKTSDVLVGLWDRLAEAGLGRGDAVIGVGGGAATDVAGFAAATWMRGVPVVQVPTTLLAMVDAAVGGKTGINTPAGKNMVGAFHPPAAVVADLSALDGLPRAELVAGFAEVVKAGFISDTRILELVEDDPDAALDPEGALPELIERAVAVKARVVGEDLKEAGPREALNYGHTFGHAVELRERFAWRHGDAVGLGMLFEAHLARECGLIDDALVERHERDLKLLGLPTTYEDGAFDELLAGMVRDKKNRNGVIRFVALDGRAGSTTRLEGPPEEALRAAYARIAR